MQNTVETTDVRTKLEKYKASKDSKLKLEREFNKFRKDNYDFT